MQPDQTLSSTNPAIKEYIAILNQSSTEPPTATILKNTLGEIPIWSYISEGRYVLEAANEIFTENKTIMFINDTSIIFFNGTVDFKWFNTTQIRISTNGSTNPEDEWLLNTPITIQIYK